MSADSALQQYLILLRAAGWQVYVCGQKQITPALNLRLQFAQVSSGSLLLVLISAVYWGALYTPEKHQLDFENVSGHLLIAAVCLLDVWVSDRPWQLSHASHPIIFGAGFTLFSLVFHFLGGTNYYSQPYIYYILDWNKPRR